MASPFTQVAGQYLVTTRDGPYLDGRTAELAFAYLGDASAHGIAALTDGLSVGVKLTKPTFPAPPGCYGCNQGIVASGSDTLSLSGRVPDPTLDALLNLRLSGTLSVPRNLPPPPAVGPPFGHYNHAGFEVFVRFGDAERTDEITGEWFRNASGFTWTESSTLGGSWSAMPEAAR